MTENIRIIERDNKIITIAYDSLTDEYLGQQYMEPGLSDWNIITADLRDLIIGVNLVIWQSGLTVDRRGKGVGPRVWVNGELSENKGTMP